MNIVVASTFLEDLMPADVTAETFLLTALMMGLIMLGMALGVIFQGKELKGSCGGKGAEDCYCDANGLPRACEMEEGHEH